MSMLSPITSAAKQAIKNAPKGTLLMNGLNTYSDYNSYRDQGASTVGAAARTAVSTALFHSNPALMTAIQTLPLVYQAGVAAHDFRRRKSEEMWENNTPRPYGGLGGGYVDTKAAQTMRQAAVQQIQGNKLNARSALGGEARLFSPWDSRK